MHFLNQLAHILRILVNILKMYFMRIYFREHQKPKYHQSPKERKESKNLRICENLSTQKLIYQVSKQIYS